MIALDMGPGVSRGRAGVRRRWHGLVARALELRGPRPPRPLHGMPQYGVLFVCHGNICRSAMAEGILRRELSRLGLFGRVWVDSAGTSAVNAGRRADGRARATVRRRGGNIGDLRARPFSAEDFDRFDLILTMDESNRRDVLSHARTSIDVERVRMLVDDAGGTDIADPIDGTRADFEHAYDAIERACNALSDQLRAAFA